MPRMKIYSCLIALIALLITAGCVQQPVREAPKSAQTPSPAGQSAAQAEDPPSAQEYLLGPGDIVRVTVYNNPDLTTEAEISQRGTLSFPLVGEVKVGGLSRASAEKTIATALNKGGFVPNAHVNILVAQYRSQQVSVIGEVQKPGKYPIHQTVNLTDLIAMAGGVSPKGGHMVTIIRKESGGRTAQYLVNFKKLMAEPDPARNVQIMGDDVVYVAPASVFYIYGEVRQPGAYPLAPDMTVRQALSLGGGLTVRGSERGIQIDRKGSDGRVTTRSAQLTDLVRPDDVVHVPEAWF